MNNLIIQKTALKIISTLAEREVERFLKEFLRGSPFANKTHAVGGYVRDQLLGKDAKDLDIVVEMKDGAKKLTYFIRKKLGKLISTPRQLGSGYPIWQITFKDNLDYKGRTYRTKGAIIEFADTMKEEFPEEKSRQRKTEYGTLAEDVERRDFTVNMLLKDLTTGEIKDLSGTSKKDLETGVLKGHPKVSLDKIFSDDPLRMIRLIRFQTKYNWKIPKSVIRTVRRNSNRIKIVSGERIRDELKKIMKFGKLAKAIRLMKAMNLLKYIFPEVEDLMGVEQPKEHHAEGDVYKHTLQVLQHAKPTIEGQLSALLHDIGKPKTKDFIKGRLTFYDHHVVGAEIAAAIARRLKFDNKVVNSIQKNVKNHMAPIFLGPKPSDKSLRKFIRNVGEETVDTILELAEADALGSLPPENYVPKLRKRIEEVKKIPIKKKPVLNGNEVMQLLNIKSGESVGKVMRFLFDLEDEYASKKKTLTKDIAKKMILKEFAT